MTSIKCQNLSNLFLFIFSKLFLCKFSKSSKSYGKLNVSRVKAQKVKSKSQNTFPKCESFCCKGSAAAAAVWRQLTVEETEDVLVADNVPTVLRWRLDERWVVLLVAHHRFKIPKEA